MSAFTPAQKQQAIGLYRRLLRTASETFTGDVATVTAWRAMVRREFEAAREEKESEKIEQGLATWEDVIRVLRHNVVQGKLNESQDAYKLRFTPDTELGSNESIRAGRQKQLDDLRASKGSAAGRSAGSPCSSRAFSTSAIQRRASASTSSASKKSDIISAASAWDKETLPRPVAHFGQTVVLSDGSTIQLFTTSPRGTVRMTRDPTNHPLWNPRLERRGGALGEEDESGRLARFRKRFGGMQEPAPAKASPATAASRPAKASEAKDTATAGATKPAKKAAAAPASQAGFSLDDFSWMSVGGREAPAGQAIKEKKGKK